MPKVNHVKLHDFCRQLLIGGGIPKADAGLVTDLLVRAELRGYAGHGVTRVNQYLAFVRNKTYDLSARPVIEREGKVTAVLDGHHYIGQIAAHMAMNLAIKKAQEHGVGIVTLRRAGHTGRLADYMEMAAAQGLVGMGAVLLDGSVIGPQCLIGANALVTPGSKIPEGSMVLGSPAKVVRPLTSEERPSLRKWAEKYVQNAAYCLKNGINLGEPL